MNLRVPGPTPLPPEVLEASAAQMINHRGPEFKELIQRVTDGMKYVFQTKHDVLLLTASGTGAMEAIVVNTLSPGDKVLAVSIGVFGNRFADIARTYGAEVAHLKFPMGQAADPDQVRQALRKNPTVKAVLVTHNETSTGVTNDLAALSQVIKGESDTLLLVDGISSVGSLPCPVDDWRLDVVASASQKGWMAPPGLAFISVNPAAWKAIEKATMPRFYFDLTQAKKSLEKGQTPWTPALSVMYSLDVGLKLIQKERLEKVIERHATLGRHTRQGVKALGLELLAEERHASNTVTAVKVPTGLDEALLRQTLRKEHRVVLAGGQGELSGKIFRIGHLGFVTQAHIDHALEALRQTLPVVGFQATSRA